MTRSYFDVLPRELIIIIVSKLDVHYNTLKDVSYNLLKLFQDDTTYKTLLWTVNPAFYNFIGTVKNIDGCDTWKNIYTYYIKGSDTTEYYIDLYYSYKIYTDFPHIYKYTKDINLNHYFVYYYASLTWKDLYVILMLPTGLNFIEGKYSVESTKEIAFQIQLLYKGRVTSLQIMFFSRIMEYISFINRDHIFSNLYLDDILEFVYSQFQFNTDIYENVLATVDIRKLIKSNEISGRALDPVEPWRSQMFIDDLKSRV